MFLKLTSGQDKKFLLNPVYIVEIVDSDGSDENVNTVLLTPFFDPGKKQYRAFEVQETIDEIEKQLGALEHESR